MILIDVTPLVVLWDAGEDVYGEFAQWLGSRLKQMKSNGPTVEFAPLGPEWITISLHHHRNTRRFF
jgi:hypothetical protein